MVPDAINNLPQLPFDLLAIMNRILSSTIFHPPEPTAIFFKVKGLEPGKFGDILISKGRGNKFYRLSGVLAVKVKGVAQECAKTLVRSKFLIKFLRLLSSHSESCSRQKTNDPITRCVNKIRGK